MGVEFGRAGVLEQGFKILAGIIIFFFFFFFFPFFFLVVFVWKVCDPWWPWSVVVFGGKLIVSLSSRYIFVF